MNQIIFNGKQVNKNEVSIGIDNRAFRYGDAIFETMYIENGGIRFLSKHLQRLREGMTEMKMEIPSEFEDYSSIINQFLNSNQLESGMLRWQVWRVAGGKYTPQFQETECIIEYQELPPVEEVKLGISNSSTVSYSSISRFKTSNALPYVLAGIEMKSSEYNDIILLNNQGHITECIASNIFWSNNKHIYTSSLSTGCVEGIMRNHVIEELKKEGVPLKIGEYGIEYFLDIQKAFITNSRGIFAVSVLGELSLNDNLNLPDSLEILRVL